MGKHPHPVAQRCPGTHCFTAGATRSLEVYVREVLALVTGPASPYVCIALEGYFALLAAPRYHSTNK
tara:strand:- start:960 stop:1160 length:201 start_codon:yes stop_codon:yes gene_type:complete